MPNTTPTGGQVGAVRRFNRLYTRHVGALREGLLGSPYTLTEARILFEVAQGSDLTATALGGTLGLDAGYLSRTLTRLERSGLLERQRSASDGRQRHLRLTAAGREAFAMLDSRANAEVRQHLGTLAARDRDRLLAAMRTIETLIEPGEARAPTVHLRPHRPGDMGWVTHRHAVLYHQEYGWDGSFEVLVGEITARFIQEFDAQRERAWIAEANGEILGSVFCVRADETTAKLRLLLVEPHARGLGLGRRLVKDCIQFARGCGYRKLVLWTNSILGSARAIYVKLGFRLVAEEAHRSFGQDLLGETWELEL